MRLLIKLRAEADAAYQNAWHHKLRGRVWQGIDGSKYDELHDADRPIGLTFSNIFPWGDIEEGDRRHVMVSAADPDILGPIAEDLVENRDFNVGEMAFSVEEITGLHPDVGEPGTRGTIESGTGVLVRIPPWRTDDYGIDHEGDEALYWRPEHTLEPFKTQLENNLDQKHSYCCPEHLPGPSDRDGELFDEYELIKTFAVPVEVTQGVELTYVLSKWRFGYRVRDDHHRRHLNLALDAGIGERNALGLGFLNIQEGSKERATASGQATVAGDD